MQNNKFTRFPNTGVLVFRFSLVVVGNIQES